jgi:hypothetical protein
MGAIRPFKPRPKGEAQPALDLLPRIEAALATRSMLPSRFGRRAANDPKLTRRIFAGLPIREGTRSKVIAYLARLEWRP